MTKSESVNKVKNTEKCWCRCGNHIYQRSSTKVY